MKNKPTQRFLVQLVIETIAGDPGKWDFTALLDDDTQVQSCELLDSQEAIEGVEPYLFSVLRYLVETENKRIQAIKELRAALGWGLRESKAFVDKHFPREVYPGNR